ncbi:MAG: P-loop NTPase [Ignavibacteriales bacterium]
MKVCVASGKGGTGKTTVAVNIAFALDAAGEPVHLIDCDVEEPDAHLFVKPSWEVRRGAFTTAPRVMEGKCTHCGVCSEVCEFHALLVSAEEVFVLKELCHSCGACIEMCPAGALVEGTRRIGETEEGTKSGIRFTHGRLTPGEAMAAPLIRQVKSLARDGRNVILDCPPGTSCPVVESVKGCDFCLLVTEPTPFGLNDLSIAVDMLCQIGVPCGVVINRSDVGTGEVEEFCRRACLPILARLPYDDNLAKSYARGIPVSTLSAEWRRQFQDLWEAVVKVAEKRVKAR